MPLNHSSSSDDEEDQARFLSVAIDSAAVVQSASKKGAGLKSRKEAASSDSEGEENGGLKHYQVKAQDALHSFLDASFGSLISAVDTPGSETASSSSESESDERPKAPDKAEQEAPGIKLFGRLPKRKTPVVGALKKGGQLGHEKQPEKDQEFDEDNIEVRKRLTAAAVGPDVIRKGADEAAARAALEAKADEARRLKELTDEGQRIAKLKRERGVAQLVKGRIVMVKEPANEEEKKSKCDEEGGKKKKKREKVAAEKSKDGAGPGETTEEVEIERIRRSKKKKRTSTLGDDGTGA